MWPRYGSRGGQCFMAPGGRACVPSTRCRRPPGHVALSHGQRDTSANIGRRRVRCEGLAAAKRDLERRPERLAPPAHHSHRNRRALSRTTASHVQRQARGTAGTFGQQAARQRRGCGLRPPRRPRRPRRPLAVPLESPRCTGALVDDARLERVAAAVLSPLPPPRSSVCEGSANTQPPTASANGPAWTRPHGLPSVHPARLGAPSLRVLGRRRWTARAFSQRGCRGALAPTAAASSSCWPARSIEARCPWGKTGEAARWTCGGSWPLVSRSERGHPLCCFCSAHGRRPA
jgi:hypothetical protein